MQLRQSYLRIAKQAAMMAGRYAHAKQFNRHRRQLRILRTRLGRINLDIHCPQSQASAVRHGSGMRPKVGFPAHPLNQITQPTIDLRRPCPLSGFLPPEPFETRLMPADHPINHCRRRMSCHASSVPGDCFYLDDRCAFEVRSCWHSERRVYPLLLP